MMRNAGKGLLCSVSYKVSSLENALRIIHAFWIGPFPVDGVLLLSYFIELHVLKANSVNPDHTLHYVASDQSLHCLPMSLL